MNKLGDERFVVESELLHCAVVALPINGVECLFRPEVRRAEPGQEVGSCGRFPEVGGVVASDSSVADGQRDLTGRYLGN